VVAQQTLELLAGILRPLVRVVQQRVEVDELELRSPSITTGRMNPNSAILSIGAQY
jgi:hypothetical protein